MIQNPIVLGCILAAIVAVITVFSKTPAGGRLFKYLPVPFYCYFIPILGATAGFFPSQSPLYKFLSQHVLPPCLVLLLIGSPWGELFRLGRQAVLAMAIGCAGMFAGSVIGHVALQKYLPPDSWMAAGALLGSWTGGSANMMAVKEALQMPEYLLAPLIIVDTAIAYGWMAILIALAGSQDSIDAWLDADRLALDASAAAAAAAHRPKEPDGAKVYFDRVLMLVCAVVVGEISLSAGKSLSQIMPVLSVSAWAVVLATTTGLVLSFTSLRQWESTGASRIGTSLLLILLASYGAQTNLRAILQSPSFMVFGVIMVLVHGVILTALGRLFRLPLFYLATASQACIGGPISTPIVAGVYQPALTHVGVILALLGGALGTYVGLLGAAVCRWLAGG